MTSVETTPKKQHSNCHRQKQKRKYFLDIGTPQVPLRQNHNKKLEREMLSDWKDAA